MQNKFEILLLEIRLWQAKGRTAQAMSKLEEALSLAQARGYVRIFVDEGDAMAMPLRQAVAAGVSNQYAKQLLTAFDAESQTGDGRKHAETKSLPISGVLTDTLNSRELEVLDLVTAGMSNQEIAQELFITIGTVKSHLNHAFGKLDVKNRTQAATRARDLQLL